MQGKRKGLSVGLQLRKRYRRLVGGGLTVFLVLALSGCSSEQQDQIKRLALPVASTTEADHVHTMWMWSWLAAIITGVIVWGLILYAAVHFRRRDVRDVPVQTRYNLPIEIFYTIAPVMMVVVFFFFTVKEQTLVQHDAAHPDQTITVVGQQWSWTFNYNLGYDKKTNKYKSVGGETVYEGGTTDQRPTLWLVKDKVVQVYLHSPDVIHSFWVPSFLYKMDDVPGRHNSFSITPTRTGTFDGRCAELCGVYHSRMLFNVKVVDQAAYDAHLKHLADEGNTGPALGSGDVQRIPGLAVTSEQG
jgi:cytochrome c oxidase subunit 2